MTKTPLQLTSEFEPLFNDLLLAIRDNLKPEKSYCAFAPRCGDKWLRGRNLMFYGRATNGWKPVFSAADVASDESRWALAQRLVQSAHATLCTPAGEPHRQYEGREADRMVEDAACDSDPMHWVEHKRKNVSARRSQFWQCANKVVRKHLSVPEKEWYSHVAWSNLYKVARLMGNPLGQLARDQREACSRILEAEITHFRPHCAVFMTEVDGKSGYFDDFKLPFEKVKAPGEYVRATGRFQFPGWVCNVILAQHPQRRPVAKVADAIVDALETLE